jgi:hypothetical protein
MSLAAPERLRRWPDRSTAGERKGGQPEIRGDHGMWQSAAEAAREPRQHMPGLAQRVHRPLAVLGVDGVAPFRLDGSDSAHAGSSRLLLTGRGL